MTDRHPLLIQAAADFDNEQPAGLLFNLKPDSTGLIVVKRQDDHSYAHAQASKRSKTPFRFRYPTAARF
jgi:hypothetical protein